MAICFGRTTDRDFARTIAPKASSLPDGPISFGTFTWDLMQDQPAWQDLPQDVSETIARIAARERYSELRQVLAQTRGLGFTSNMYDAFYSIRKSENAAELYKAFSRIFMRGRDTPAHLALSREFLEIAACGRIEAPVEFVKLVARDAYFCGYYMWTRGMVDYARRIKRADVFKAVFQETRPVDDEVAADALEKIMVAHRYNRELMSVVWDLIPKKCYYRVMRNVEASLQAKR